MQRAKRAPILVCTPERASCKRLVTIGAGLAKEEDRPLKVLSVQPEELVTPDTAENIQILHNIASGTGAEITVLFSDNPILTSAVFAKQLAATRVIVDESDLAGDVFFQTLRDLLPDVSLSLLQKDGKLVTFPPTYEKHTVT